MEEATLKPISPKDKPLVCSPAASDGDQAKACLNVERELRIPPGYYGMQWHHAPASANIAALPCPKCDPCKLPSVHTVNKIEVDGISAMLARKLIPLIELFDDDHWLGPRSLPRMLLSQTK